MLTQGWRVARTLLPCPDARRLAVPAPQSGLRDRAVLWPRAEVVGTALGRQAAGWMKCVAPCAPRPGWALDGVPARAGGGVPKLQDDFKGTRFQSLHPPSQRTFLVALRQKTLQETRQSAMGPCVGSAGVCAGGHGARGQHPPQPALGPLTRAAPAQPSRELAPGGLCGRRQEAGGHKPRPDTDLPPEPRAQSEVTGARATGPRRGCCPLPSVLSLGKGTPTSVCFPSGSGLLRDQPEVPASSSAILGMGATGPSLVVVFTGPPRGA